MVTSRKERETYSLLNLILIIQTNPLASSHAVLGFTAFVTYEKKKDKKVNYSIEKSLPKRKKDM